MHFSCPLCLDCISIVFIATDSDAFNICLLDMYFSCLMSTWNCFPFLPQMRINILMFRVLCNISKNLLFKKITKAIYYIISIIKSAPYFVLFFCFVIIEDLFLIHLLIVIAFLLCIYLLFISIIKLYVFVYFKLNFQVFITTFLCTHIHMHSHT